MSSNVLAKCFDLETLPDGPFPIDFKTIALDQDKDKSLQTNIC